MFVPDKTATRDLFLAFNRGFTRGYLFGDSKGKLMSRDRPDNRGLFIGTVSRYDRKTGIVTVHPDKSIDIHTGDGLLFSHPENPEAAWGFSLNTKPCVKADGIELAVPRNVEKGSLTFLTASVGLASRSRQIINRPDPGLVTWYRSIWSPESHRKDSSRYRERSILPAGSRFRLK